MENGTRLLLEGNSGETFISTLKQVNFIIFGY
jgi:hypothetical protein